MLNGHDDFSDLVVGFEIAVGVGNVFEVEGASDGRRQCSRNEALTEELCRPAHYNRVDCHVLEIVAVHAQRHSSSGAG
jgi:hypothetical protein